MLHFSLTKSISCALRQNLGAALSWPYRVLASTYIAEGEIVSIAVVQNATRPSSSVEGDFLAHAKLSQGPVGFIGRYFLKAYSNARARGVTITFGTLSDIVTTNEANLDSWLPLLAIFDGRFFTATPENLFCIVARDPYGRIVGTHAARLYDWSGTNFHDEATALRLFYDDPDMRRPAERCTVTAPSAKSLRGLTVYSGAAWVHPTYRGRGLSAILPNVAKAYALTRWPAQTIVSLMSEEVQRRGFASRFGYTNIDWHVDLENSAVGTRRLALLSVTREQTFDIMYKHLADRPKIDADVLSRRAQ